MLPNLSALPTSAGRCPQWPEAPTPPPPGDNGDDRYVYLWHRPRDASFPQPELVNRIAFSGGVVPDYAIDDPMSVPQMRPLDAESFADGIYGFLMHDMDARTRLTHGSVGSLAWFYMNRRSEGTALEYANEHELVFRVPREWLVHNALSCSEQPPRDDHSPPGYFGSRFVTALRVPLEYRILSTTPLRNEENRAMSFLEVTDLLYGAHVAEDPLSRMRYESPPPPTPPHVFVSPF